LVEVTDTLGRVTSPVVVADQVVKGYGATPVLRGATFTVGDGVTGLLGANGTGKTTLLGLLLGLHRADSGSLTVLGGDPWTNGPEVRIRLGYAPEFDALAPDAAANDVVRHSAELHGLPHREATGRASDALWEVGLGEERFRPVGTMSTGQRQRVKLAQAIVHDPRLVLLDEPTNGLDPAQREDMLELIRHVGHDLGMNVILSSHLLEEVERVSDAVIILDGGVVVAGGTLADLQATGQDLLVELDGGAEASDRLVALLAPAGVAAHAIAPGRIIVALERPAVYDIVRDMIAEGRLGLRRLEARRASLEDVFLAAAGPDGHVPAVVGADSIAGDHDRRSGAGL
jgi:ABC-2 type transport system ATP-binding protein